MLRHKIPVFSLHSGKKETVPKLMPVPVTLSFMETGFSKSRGIIKSLPSLDCSSLIQLIRSQGKYTRLNRPFNRYDGHIDLSDLRSVMGCPGGTRSVFTRVFWGKRELQCIFFGKKAIIIRKT